MMLVIKYMESICFFFFFINRTAIKYKKVSKNEISKENVPKVLLYKCHSKNMQLQLLAKATFAI